MNNREQFEKYKEAGIIQYDAQTRIEALVNNLIHWLYKPIEGDGEYVANHEVCGPLGLDEEPINWGDLKCREVEQNGDKWIVTIDEAAPNECPNLCAYIEIFMRSWGWEVEVKTEW